jgi:hypothetical protein
MIYNNNDERALYARDMELWYPDEDESEPEVCEHCGETLEQGYYDINNSKLCENCAKLEYREYFEEFEDLEQLKQECDYDSEEDLIEMTINENLYKYWRSF